MYIFHQQLRCIFIFKWLSIWFVLLHKVVHLNHIFYCKLIADFLNAQLTFLGKSSYTVAEIQDHWSIKFIQQNKNHVNSIGSNNSKSSKENGKLQNEKMENVEERELFAIPFNFLSICYDFMPSSLCH